MEDPNCPPGAWIVIDFRLRIIAEFTHPQIRLPDRS